MILQWLASAIDEVCEIVTVNRLSVVLLNTRQIIEKIDREEYANKIVEIESVESVRECSENVEKRGVEIPEVEVREIEVKEVEVNKTIEFSTLRLVMTEQAVIA